MKYIEKHIEKARKEYSAAKEDTSAANARPMAHGPRCAAGCSRLEQSGWAVI